MLVDWYDERVARPLVFSQIPTVAGIIKSVLCTRPVEMRLDGSFQSQGSYDGVFGHGGLAACMSAADDSFVSL